MRSLNLESLNFSEKQELARLLGERERRTKRRKLYTLYPAEGPLRRELYAKSMQFFAAGATERERAVVAANRVGKSFGIGGYEVALHVTGRYPDWWEGRRFSHPVDAWAASVTGEVTLYGPHFILTVLSGERQGELGTGLIPGDDIIGEPSRKNGPYGAIDTIAVRHTTGGVSKLSFKSYDQGREKFQGTAKHVVWLDEEPPLPIYSECLTRTMTCDGIVLATFTPLVGLSDVVLKFMPGLAPTTTV